MSDQLVTAIISSLVSICLAVITSGVAYYLAESQRKKNIAEADKSDADAAESLTGSSLELVRAYRERIAELERERDIRVEQLERKVNELEHRVEVVEGEKAALVIDNANLVIENRKLRNENRDLKQKIETLE